MHDIVSHLHMHDIFKCSCSYAALSRDQESLEEEKHFIPKLPLLFLNYNEPYMSSKHSVTAFWWN